MEIGEWVRLKRLEAGLTQQSLADLLEITRQHVGEIERGKVSRLSELLFLRAVRLFGRPPDEILVAHMPDPSKQMQELVEEIAAQYQRRFDEDQYGRLGTIRMGRVLGDQQSRIPLMNKAPAGDPHDYGDMDYPPGVAAVEYIDRGDIPNDLPVEAFTVVGDSMEPEYRHGDICIIAPENVREGDDCFVRISEDSPKFPGHCTFKRVSFEDGRVVLKPINPAPQHRYLILDREHARLFPVIELRRKTLYR